MDRAHNFEQFVVSFSTSEYVARAYDRDTCRSDDAASPTKSVNTNSDQQKRCRPWHDHPSFLSATAPSKH